MEGPAERSRPKIVGTGVSVVRKTDDDLTITRLHPVQAFSVLGLSELRSPFDTFGLAEDDALLSET